MHQTDHLTGTVERIIFQNAENGFTVFVLKESNRSQTTVKGFLTAIHPGEQVTLSGSWIMHPKFGKQFEASSCTTQVPTSVMGLKKYLSSGLIKGIGPVYADKLIAAFGAQVLEVIDKEPERLTKVDGIGPKRAHKIVTAWQDQKEISHIMVFLQEKGASPAYATKIFKKYGARSIDVLTENPYRLADEIWGIGFKIADQIAQNMGFSFDSVKRITAGILFTIAQTTNTGNLYCELSELKERAMELLGLSLDLVADKVKQAFHTLHDQQKIKVVTLQDFHYVTLSQYYFSERGVAQRIKELQSYPHSFSFDIQAIYNKLRINQTGIELNEDQQQGIMTALQNKITIITGGPGTGKTTLIKELLGLLDEHKARYKLAAPTGRAAKRITQGTGRPAATLHRLLEFDPGIMGFTRNEQNALALDFLIVDEASMIDIFLAHALLRAIPFTGHLILLGDIDQLPSVGAGNFLRDLIASKVVPTIRLTHIFRQAQNSMIIVNAHRINEGLFPTMTTTGESKKDFIYIKEQEPDAVPKHLENIFAHGLRKWHLQPQDAMVLVPMNRGSVGTIALNHYLQQYLNPRPSQTHQHHGTTFAIGDRVMQIRNNYDKHIFNGDTGTVAAIDTQERTVAVLFDERNVIYEYTELDELVLAYAVSIHKSQGSEYPAVIIPLFMQHFTLLQRNLIYTAVTRAKKVCILLGQPKAIAMAIKNNKSVKRTTFLQEMLTTEILVR